MHGGGDTVERVSRRESGSCSAREAGGRERQICSHAMHEGSMHDERGTRERGRVGRWLTSRRAFAARRWR